jgi:hypothetical protein
MVGRLTRCDRARGTVERCEEPVARGVDLDATEPVELPADARVVVVEQESPAVVTELLRLLSGAVLGLGSARVGTALGA